MVRIAVTQVTITAHTTFGRDVCFRSAHHLPMRP
jgi:hypothetical protein